MDYNRLYISIVSRGYVGLSEILSCTKMFTIIKEVGLYLIYPRFYLDKTLSLGHLYDDLIMVGFKATEIVPKLKELNNLIEMEHEDKLKEVMEMAYQSVLGFTDNCTIVKEK